MPPRGLEGPAGWADAEAVIPEETPVRQAAARRAAARPLVPGDHLEVYATRPEPWGHTTVCVRRPVYDLVTGVQVGWQCWELLLQHFRFAPLLPVEITRWEPADPPADPPQ